MRITVKAKLAGNISRQRLQDSQILSSDVSLNESNLLLCIGEDTALTCSRISQNLIELCNQLLDGRNEFNQAFWNKHSTKVVAFSSTISYNLSDVGNHVVKRHFLFLNFLGNETDVGLRLESTFQSDMRSRTPHQLNEMPVLAGTVAVTLDIANQLAVGLAGSIETKTCLNLVVLQVTINRLGAANHLHAIFLGSIVFGQNTGIGVGIVAAN